MINTVIFDLDGLLADSESVFYQLYQDLLAPYGHSFTMKHYGETYCGKTLKENMQSIVKDYDLPLTPQQAQKFMEEDEESYMQKGIPLKNGAKILLDYLKEHNYNIVLATSSLPERALRILRFNEAVEYFDAMVFGPDVKKGKPEPDVFLLAAEKVNAKVENCLVLEDSEQGVLASYRAGIRVICIPDVKMPSRDYIEISEGIYDNLTEVISYLETED